MALELCVLGSGSSGNSTLVRSAQGSFLIDAGFGPRVTEQRLHGTGVQIQHLRAILLTHLDSDHFNLNWFRTLVAHNIRVYCDRRKLREITHAPEFRDLSLRLPDIAAQLLPLLTPFDPLPFEPVPGVTVHPLPLAHDSTGSHGFVLTCQSYRVGYATDLGHVPPELIEFFTDVDALLLEANYDPEMQIHSPRPYYLKQRIMGGTGHLSNEQARAAIRAILDRTESLRGPERLPRHIVLLHRSRQCNCPKLVESFFEQDPRVARVLTLAHQTTSTGWLHLRVPKILAIQARLWD